MILLRFILMAMNAVAFGFLIYWLLKLNDYSLSVTRKRVILAGGIILLLLPGTMIMGFVRPTAVYMLMYPVAIALFIYLFRMPE